MTTKAKTTEEVKEEVEKKIIKEKKVTLDELKEKYNVYMQQYEKTMKFAVKLEGVLDFLGGQIKQLEDEKPEENS